jgi:rubrerythrin
MWLTSPEADLEILMSRLPPTAPATTGAAFAHINAVVSPTIDDLKLMVFLEASGLCAYEELAQSTPNAAVGALLRANGREELAHAHRVAKVIERLTGEVFAPPAAEDNPYARPSGLTVDRPLLERIIAAETNGESLYETWASHTSDPEAAALLRQNGKEEIRHGERAAEAMALLPPS